MAGDDAFGDFRIAALQYDTPLLGRTSGIEEVATSILHQLEDIGLFKSYDEIYFIAHSMGGLVVKRMLVKLKSARPLYELRRIKAVLYISTPAQGVSIAEAGAWISANPQLNDMAPADLNSYLQSVENDWQDLIRERGTSMIPRSYCAYETKPTLGIVIVSRIYAATTCDQNPHPVAEDHAGIVKPASTDADIYAWAKARIQEASILAQGLRLEYSLWKEPYNYKPGLKVDGVEWKENYQAYEFAVRNPSKTESIIDLRLHFEFPWAIISSQLHYHEGSEGVALAGRDDDTVKVGTERQIQQIVRYRTNVLEINARTIFPEGVFRGKVILNGGGMYSDNSNLQASHRDETSPTRRSFAYRIAVLDKNTGTLRIEPTPLKDEPKMSIIMEFEEPIQFKRR